MLKVCRVYFFDELVFEFLNNISSSTKMIWNHGRSVLDGGCQPWKFIAFTPDGMSAPAVVGIQTHYSPFFFIIIVIYFVLQKHRYVI